MILCHIFFCVLIVPFCQDIGLDKMLFIYLCICAVGIM